jgi:branched-chain amino acid transport system permease protein
MSLTAKVKIGLLALAFVIAASLPYVLTPFMVEIMTLALIMGLFAMSIDLLAGFGGLTTLGQAGILSTAAYGVAYVSREQLGGAAVQIGVGLAAGMVVTVVFAAMAMRTRGIYFIMVTTAQGMIVWGLALRLSGITGAENGIRGIARPPAVGAWWEYYYLCLVVVAICGGLLWVITRSPFGLAFRGLRESEGRLAMLGYNTVLHKFYAFVLSGFFATVAGILFVYRDRFISPAASEFLASGNGVLMAILGGLGTLIGPVIGAFIIVLIENVLSSYVERWPTLLGTLFILTILFARQGIVGEISRRWSRLMARRGEEGRGAARPPADTVLERSDGSEEATTARAVRGGDG